MDSKTNNISDNSSIERFNEGFAALRRATFPVFDDWRLSKRLYLSDFTRNDIAMQNGIINCVPDLHILTRLWITATILDYLRDRVDAPQKYDLEITQGYRTVRLDNILTGSEILSPHVEGLACVFKLSKLKALDEKAILKAFRMEAFTMNLRCPWFGLQFNLNLYSKRFTFSWDLPVEINKQISATNYIKDFVGHEGIIPNKIKYEDYEQQ